MGTETSVVVALFFMGFLFVSAFTYSWVNSNQNLVNNAQNVHDTMKNAWLQTAIKITNVSFSNSSGNVSLNITLKNTGKTTLNASRLSIFVNGTYYGSSYCMTPTINTWVPKQTKNITVSGTQNIQIDNTSNNLSYGSSMVWSHTVSSGLVNSLLVVGVDITHPGNTAITVTKITYNGIPLNRTNYSTDGGSSSNNRAEIWNLTSPPNGTHNIVVNLSGTDVQGTVAGAVSLSGVDQNNPLPISVNNTYTSNPASTQITTVDANAMIIDTITVDNAIYINATPPQKQLWNIPIPLSSNNAGGGSIITTCSAGSYNMSWSLSSSLLWVQVVAEIKPAAIYNTLTRGRVKVVTENGISDYAIV